MAKNKEEVEFFKAIREKKILSTKGVGESIRNKPDLLYEIIWVRRQWNDIFKLLNKRNLSRVY